MQVGGCYCRGSPTAGHCQRIGCSTTRNRYAHTATTLATSSHTAAARTTAPRWRAAAAAAAATAGTKAAHARIRCCR